MTLSSKSKIYDLKYYKGYGQRWIQNWEDVPDILERLELEIEELKTNYEKWGKST